MTKGILHLTDISFAVMLVLMFHLIEDGLTQGVVVVCVAIFSYVALKSYLNPIVFVDGRPSLVNAEILLYMLFYILFFHPYIEAAFFDLNLQYHSKFEREYISESNRAIIASTLAVLGFSAGAGFCLFKSKQAHLHIQPPPKEFAAVIFVLFALSIAIFILLGGSDWIFASYNRRMQTEAGFVNEVFALAGWLSAVAIGSSLFSLYIKKKNIFVYLNITLALAWFLIILMIGDRNMMLLNLVVILAFVSLYYFRIRMLVVIVLLGLALTAYNAIAEVRRAPDKSLALILSEAIDPRHATGLSETNFSTQTTIVRATIYIVPHDIDYFFGNFTLNSVLSVVPFSRSVLKLWTDAPANTSEIIRSYTLGDHANHGTGTTIISDLYFDFGILYVFLGMGTLGFIWSIIKYRAQCFPLSHNNVLIYLISISFLAQCARYDLAMPVRYIGLTIILISIVRFLSERRGVARRRKHH